MKLNLLALLALPAVMYSQEAPVADSLSHGGKYPNTFTSGSSRVEKFNNKTRLFNDWAISVGGGTALMKYADLTSFYGNKVDWGWNAYVSLDKQITHSFGLSLQYQQGETNQKAMLKESYGVAEGKTKYRQVSILGDINFSNLLRRIDNHSKYRWALHGYAGLGVEGFDTKLTDHADRSDVADWFVTKGGTMHQDLGIASFFFQGGLGLKYKISRIVDLEARVMYIITGDDEFDGGGDANASTNQKIAYTHSDYPYNSIKKNNSDNFFTANLGLTFKLGKHISHLTWHDPLQETFYKINLLENRKVDLNVCEKGDLDNDGVCDDWDRQLDTPAGARVDGAGVALDTDLDGVIDLNDKCVTVAGPVENEGCPVVETTILDKSQSIKEINKNFEGIEFDLNKDVIRTISFSKLDNAASIIKRLDQNEKYLVVGATDVRGGDAYNMNLSQRRADAVVKYLVNKGVNPSMLTAEGRGKNDLKYPECNPASKCPEWKNEANRRVYFIEK